jgi:hypothetical protein
LYGSTLLRIYQLQNKFQGKHNHHLFVFSAFRTATIRRSINKGGRRPVCQVLHRRSSEHGLPLVPVMKMQAAKVHVHAMYPAG